MADKYKSFNELAKAEAQNAYRMRLTNRNSRFVVAAPHGGGIEPGTSEIAEEIAAQEFSCYQFEGMKLAGNEMLHITSSNFDEPQGIAMLRRAALVLTVHGEKTAAHSVYLGGLHMPLKAALRTALEERGYAVLEHANPSLRGSDAANICNIGLIGAGVQLELPRGLRETFFASLDRSGRSKPTARLAQFAALIRAVLREFQDDTAAERARS